MSLHLDQLLDEIGAGPHQWLHIAIMCLILMLAGANLYSFIFLVAAPDFRCFIPGVDNRTAPSYTDLKDEAQLAAWQPCTIGVDGVKRFDACQRFTEPQRNVKNCTVNSASSTATLVRCTRWVYDMSIYRETGVTNFDLVCERRIQQAVVQDMYQIGLVLGCALSGYLSDRIGRRYACMAFLLLHAAVGTSSVFAGGSIAVFEIFRVLCGFTSGALSNVPLVYALELVRHSHRKHVNFVLLISMTSGAVITGFIAWALHGAWRPLQLVLSLPAVLPLLLLAAFGAESFRWLLSKQKYSEAERIIRLACKRNRVQSSEEVLRQILCRAEREQHSNKAPSTADAESKPSVAHSAAMSHKNDTWLALWRWPQMRAKLLILLVCWLCVSLVLTGLQVNSVNLPGLNVYVSFIIVSAMEFPGNALALAVIDRLGRRACVAMFFILTGILNAMAGIVPLQWHMALVLVPTFLAKLTSTATWNAANIFAAEIFPTTVRTSGLGLCFLAADVGGIVAPFVTLLSAQKTAPTASTTTRFIPPLIFCLASLAGGVLCTLLPETLDAELTQTQQNTNRLRKPNGYALACLVTAALHSLLIPRDRRAATTWLCRSMLRRITAAIRHMTTAKDINSIGVEQNNK